MVRVGEDQGILTLEHQKKTSGSIYLTMWSSSTDKPSRFTGAHHSVMLRLFWLGLTSPPEHVQNRL